MDVVDHLVALRREGERLAAVAELGLREPVPSCPGWTVADLVAHTGEVHRHKERIVREGWTQGPPEGVEAPDDGLLAWYREGLEALLATLAAHDPEERVWSWFDADQTVGFWCRRMAHETAVHRIDAELAHQVVTDVDSVLAADGVDELLGTFMTGYPEWAEIDVTEETIRLETTDAAGSWGLRFVTFGGHSPRSGLTFDEEPTVIFDETADASTVVRGTAEALLRFLWGRGPVEALDVMGDADVLAELRAIAVDVTQ